LRERATLSTHGTSRRARASPHAKTQTVSSQPLVAIVVPSPETAIERIAVPWPTQAASRPDSTSSVRIALAPSSVTNVFPSGVNAASPVSPRRCQRFAPVVASQRRRPSPPVDAIQRPSDDHAIERIVAAS